MLVPEVLVLLELELLEVLLVLLVLEVPEVLEVLVSELSDVSMPSSFSRSSAILGPTPFTNFTSVCRSLSIIYDRYGVCPYRREK